jgi:shikimate kinase
MVSFFFTSTFKLIPIIVNFTLIHNLVCRLKTLYILIGLKGSGKTFIGKLIEDKFGITFLRVENIFKNIKRDRGYSDKNYIKEGFALLEQEIRHRFVINDSLIIESTGLTDEFKQMFESLRKDLSVKLIKIDASPALCLKRVGERDSKEHINVSDSDVEKINELAMKVKFDYDLVIDNNTKDKEEIIKGLESLSIGAR